MAPLGVRVGVWGSMGVDQDDVDPIPCKGRDRATVMIY
jgi:hypothetical protein